MAVRLHACMHTDRCLNRDATNSYKLSHHNSCRFSSLVHDNIRGACMHVLPSPHRCIQMADKAASDHLMQSSQLVDRSRNYKLPRSDLSIDRTSPAHDSVCVPTSTVSMASACVPTSIVSMSAVLDRAGARRARNVFLAHRMYTRSDGLYPSMRRQVMRTHAHSDGCRCGNFTRNGTLIHSSRLIATVRVSIALPSIAMGAGSEQRINTRDLSSW